MVIFARPKLFAYLRSLVEGYLATETKWEKVGCLPRRCWEPIHSVRTSYVPAFRLSSESHCWKGMIRKLKRRLSALKYCCHWLRPGRNENQSGERLMRRQMLRLATAPKQDIPEQEYALVWTSFAWTMQQSPSTLLPWVPSTPRGGAQLYAEALPADYMSVCITDDRWISQFEHDYRTNRLSACILLYSDGIPVCCNLVNFRNKNTAAAHCAPRTSHLEDYNGWGEVVSITGHPSEKGKGYGGILMEEILRRLKSDGFEQCYVLVPEKTQVHAGSMNTMATDGTHGSDHFRITYALPSVCQKKLTPWFIIEKQTGDYRPSDVDLYVTAYHALHVCTASYNLLWTRLRIVIWWEDAFLFSLPVGRTIAICVGTGVGINAMLSRRLGENRKDEASAVALNGFFVFCAARLFFLFSESFIAPRFIFILYR